MIIIETERLVLRPVTLDDAEAMFEYASDKENTRYTFPTNQSLEETKNNIAQFYLDFDLLGKYIVYFPCLKHIQTWLLHHH